MVSVILILGIGAIVLGNVETGEWLASLWASYSAAILASLVLLPLIVWDMIRFSHRVVGPLIRLEREMQRLAEGESVRPLRFRENDYWHGLAKRFNGLRARHIELKHKARVVSERLNDRVGEPVVIPRYPV